MNQQLPTSPSNVTTSAIKARYHRALNYLSIYLFVLVVYGGALITDYLLILLVEWLLEEDVAKYPIVALGFDYAKIGLALLLIITAFVHGVISTIGQIKLDISLSKEDLGAK